MPVFWFALLFLTLASAALYFFVFYPDIQVADIIISGNKKTQSGLIKNAVLENINKEFLSVGGWTLKSESIFLVDADALNKEILSKFPLIENLKIDKSLPHTLILGITERKPVAVFCPFMDALTNENQGRCFLIDQNGIIFESISAPVQDMAIVRQLIEKGSVFSGEKAVDENIMAAISKINKSLKDNFKINVKDALITSPVRLDIITSENWQIYFNLDKGFNIDLQVAKLNLLLKDEILPEIRQNLQYIDLRFKDRAYYK